MVTKSFLEGVQLGNDYSYSKGVVSFSYYYDTAIARVVRVRVGKDGEISCNLHKALLVGSLHVRLLFCGLYSCFRFSHFRLL